VALRHERLKISRRKKTAEEEESGKGGGGGGDAAAAAAAVAKASAQLRAVASLDPSELARGAAKKAGIDVVEGDDEGEERESGERRPNDDGAAAAAVAARIISSKVVSDAVASGKATLDALKAQAEAAAAARAKAEARTAKEKAAAKAKEQVEEEEGEEEGEEGEEGGDRRRPWRGPLLWRSPGRRKRATRGCSLFSPSFFFLLLPFSTWTIRIGPPLSIRYGLSLGSSSPYHRSTAARKSRGSSDDRSGIAPPPATAPGSASHAGSPPKSHSAQM